MPQHNSDRVRYALFLRTRLPVVGASALVFAGAAFFGAAALVGATFFATAEPFKAFPTLLTIVVPVEVPDVPEVLLAALTVRCSAVEVVAVTVAPRLGLPTGAFDSVLLAFLVFAVLAIIAVVAFPLPVTMFARLLVAAAAAALKGEVVGLSGDCGRERGAFCGDPKGRRAGD